MQAAKMAGGTDHRARVTISDVAARLGLTKGTVSRALNGYPDISDRTRRRVSRAAAEMGYRPLAQAQAIRTGRARAIGLVLQVSEHDAHSPFLTDFLAGVTGAASAETWTLTVATAPTAAAVRETLARLVDERKADGFILPRTLRHDPRAAYLRAAGVPFILYGRTADDAGCAWFDILGEDAMRDAVLRLHDLRHRRIGFVGGGREYNYSVLRHEGYLEGLRLAGLAHDGRLVRQGARRPTDGASAARDLLTLPEPPTAIVFATDQAALGAYRTAASLGLEVGRDVSFIAYDGIPEGRYARPPLTTYSVDARAAGERLADLLIRCVRGEPPERLRECRPAQLVAGGSDGPAPGIGRARTADHDHN